MSFGQDQQEERQPVSWRKPERQEGLRGVCGWREADHATEFRAWPTARKSSSGRFGRLARREGGSSPRRVGRGRRERRQAGGRLIRFLNGRTATESNTQQPCEPCLHSFSPGLVPLQEANHPTWQVLQIAPLPQCIATTMLPKPV